MISLQGKVEAARPVEPLGFKIATCFRKMIMRIALVAFNARFIHCCPGLFHVRNELEAHCPEAQLHFFQMTVNDSYYEILLRIADTEPDFVFFSTAIWNSDLVEKLAVDLKTCLPFCRFAVGGPQAATVGSNLGDEMCTVVTGAIEAVGPDFYRHLRAGELDRRYHGPFLRALDFSSPYRESDFELYLQNRHIYYETSRGCPYSCTYCLSSAERGILHKGLDQVREELGAILSHRPAVVRFVDRTFNDMPERALAIWKMALELREDTLCHFEISPDRFTEEMFDFLRQVPPGAFQFEIGIQSANPETLLAVHRPMDIDRASGIVSRLASFANIHLHVDLILGLPCETRQSFLDSFSRVFSMGAHYIQMGLLKILPDTPIRRDALEFGYGSCRNPPYAVVASKWMDRRTMGGLYRFGECVERFMNNRSFVSLWGYLRRIGEDPVSFFFGLLSICVRESFFDLAATQELMCRMLLQATADRGDALVIRDLILFDWLRCGHRFLPACLAQDRDEPVSELKRRLFRLLPEEIDGVYRSAEKAQFFKKALFAEISAGALSALGFGERPGDGVVCFFPERDGGLYGYCRYLLLDL